MSNTSQIQAVQNNLLKTTEVVFYQPGTIKINNNVSITAESPCIVLVKTGVNSIERLAVADPTEKLKTLQFRVTAPIENSGKNWNSSWNSQTKESTIEVDLPTEGYAGQSVVVDFSAKR